MGVKLWSEIQNRIAKNAGYRIADTNEIRGYAYDGLVDLIGRLKFDQYKTYASFPITEGDSTYALPAGAIGVRTLEINTQRLILSNRLPTSTSAGKPSRYLRTADGIKIWPTPDADYAGLIEYVAEPAMPLDTAVVPLPGIYDTAIIQLGTHHALMGLGDPEATKWLNLYKQYEKEHLGIWDVEQDAIRPGLQVARSWDDLRGDNDFDDN